jgi:hypothetical protein
VLRLLLIVLVLVIGRCPSTFCFLLSSCCCLSSFFLLLPIVFVVLLVYSCFYDRGAHLSNNSKRILDGLGLRPATIPWLQVAIPSYLTALAVGELKCRELSERSRVWSEPSVVDAAAYEFAETAKYLQAGGYERLCTAQ